MDARSNEQRYPSVEEFSGWYNLGYQRPDGVPVLHSQRHVPEFEHAEFFDLYIAENRWFEDLVPKSDLKPFDPVADPPMFVRSSADDRTLEVYPDFHYLTADLIKRIQKEFLGRHPFWRVMLMAYAPSCTIVVYPEAIRFGNLPIGVDAEEALRELVRRAVAAQEARLRPEREQLAFLQQRLPEAVRAIGDRPFLVAGVLDNDQGNHDWLVIVLLLHGDRAHAIDIEGPSGVDDDSLWSRGGFDVDSAGRFISASSMSSPAAYRVALWCLPADYRCALAITDRETGKSHVYELKSGNITHTFTTE